MVDDCDAVAEEFGFFHVVGCEHDCHAVSSEVVDEIPHSASGLGVEAGCGFVEEHCDGVVDECDGDREALFLSAGEVFVLGLGAFGEVDFFESFFGGHVGAVKGGEEFDGLFEVEVVEEGVLLELDSDHAFDAGWISGYVYACDVGFAAVEVTEALKDLDSGGLAGAVGSEHSEDFAATDFEGDTVYGDDVFVSLVEVADLDDDVVGVRQRGCLSRRLRSEGHV